MYLYLYIVWKVKLESGVKSIISPGSVRLKEGGGTVEFYFMPRFLRRRDMKGQHLRPDKLRDNQSQRKEAELSRFQQSVPISIGLQKG